MLQRFAILCGILATSLSYSAQGASITDVTYAYSINTQTNQLVKINLTSGEVTAIGDVGEHDYSALAFGPNSVLYAVDKAQNYNTSSALYTIDTQTAVVTKVGDLNYSITGFVTLTADHQGRLYTVIQQPCYYKYCHWDDFRYSALAEIDKTTGAARNLSRPADNVRGMAYSGKDFWYINDYSLSSRSYQRWFSNGENYFPYADYVEHGVYYTFYYEDHPPEYFDPRLLNWQDPSFVGMATDSQGQLWSADQNGQIYTLNKANGGITAVYSSGLPLQGFAIDVLSIDSDNDGLADAFDGFPLDPKETNDHDFDGIGDNADTDDDNDGLSDEDELNIYGTSPKFSDFDGDYLPDGYEVQHGFSPKNADGHWGLDSDNDGFTNYQEYLVKTSPIDPAATPPLIEQFVESFENTQPGEPLPLNFTDNSWLISDWDVSTEQASNGRKSVKTKGYGSLTVAGNFSEGKLLLDIKSNSYLGGYYINVDNKNSWESGIGYPVISEQWNTISIDLSAGFHRINISPGGTYGLGASFIDNIRFLSVNTDSDNDGMNDSWEYEHGLDYLSDDGELDLDYDGFTNLQEYHGGSDPKDREHTPKSHATANFAYEFFETESLSSAWSAPLWMYRQVSWQMINGIGKDGTSGLTWNGEDYYSKERMYIDWSQYFNKGKVYFDTYQGDGEHRSHIRMDTDKNSLLYYNVPRGDHIWRRNIVALSEGIHNLSFSSYGIEGGAPNVIDNVIFIADRHDNDKDGIADQWEYENGMDIFNAADAYFDSDGDGLTNVQEFERNTNPFNSDSDNDGIIDSQDDWLGDNRDAVDTDGDGIGNMTDTDDDNDGINDTDDVAPLDAQDAHDSDGDGYGDFADLDDDNDGVLDTEDAFPYDPTESADLDRDGIGNNADTDDDNDGVLDVNDAFPLDASETVDTDGDGIGNNADTDDDNDGLTDAQERTEYKTNPLLTDTDGDGLTDSQEVNEHQTDPLKFDTDGDGLSDGFELANQMDPLSSGDDAQSDFDQDGLTNLQEMALGTDPRVADTDGDGLNDFVESQTHLTNPLKADTDDDGLTDLDELNTHGTDPLKADTDGDQLPDGWELQYGLNPKVADAEADLDNDGRDNLTEFNDGSHPAQPEIVDKEANETLETAQSLALAFHLGYSKDIGDATENTSEQIPHATVLGKGEGEHDVDVYSFEVSKNNSRVILDIDQYAGQGKSFDAYIEVYDANGKFMFANDDAQWRGVGQDGSQSETDSFVDVKFEKKGKYYVKVLAYGEQPIPQGAVYRLQVSVENHGLAD